MMITGTRASPVQATKFEHAKLFGEFFGQATTIATAKVTSGA